MPSDHDSPRTDPRTTRHRSTPARTLVRRALTGTAVAALAAGVLAGNAVANEGGDRPDTAAAALAAAESRQAVAPVAGERGSTTSRSASRGPVDPAKAALLMSAARSGGQVTRTAELGGGDPKAIAQAMLGQFGFGSDQFSCLESLWEKESGWDPHASNASSGAYGIPQSLPGSKMASAGADWQTNPATQIEWGLGYIRDSYGSPCSAWGHSEANGWY